MKKSFYLSIFLTVIFSLGMLVSCGGDDDNPVNPPVAEKSYIKAKITGDYNDDYSTDSVIYNTINENKVIIKSNEVTGIFLSFPKDITGTFAIDSITYIGQFHQSQQTLQVKYVGYNGSITITQNDSKKIKGTFNYNAKTEKDNKNIVVNNGEFQYIFK